ncbi:MAG: HPr kinase/phosphatase C-terminal domain-containing protein [Alphaproteobacteria bacterium]|nr:HPr kinase/phosphatase C-terminal domain-containing protein [Alphaproteobacteria bacterium]MBU2379206.1 HPr kinase/phosphatase C-terminal domain-containing protein [Alphaproteobacteria bacterium]
MNPPIHATAVARAGQEGWRGALLRGPPGSGKSDLALRLIDQGWRLVADDYVLVWASGQTLHATAPERLSGRIEARGLGIVATPALVTARMILIVDCMQQTCERMPEGDRETIHGVRLPRLRLDIRPASAVRTLDLAMDGFNRRPVWPI